MWLFSSILFIMLSMHVGNATWTRHYQSPHRLWELLPRPYTKLCITQAILASLYGGFVPSCSDLAYYSHKQSDGGNMWCADKYGNPIKHTPDKVWKFPYDCSKTRECPIGKVQEKTGRCEAKCGEVDKYKMVFDCENECICPRGMFRNLEDECVWQEDCPKLEPCKAPMVYSSCVSKCPLTCAHRKHTCVGGCAKGIHCACPKGKILLTKFSDRCVKRKNCPKCNYGSLPTECAPACPNTCPGNGECTAEGCEKGAFCVCKPGKIRLDHMLPVKCVTPEECPPICEAPKVRKGCGTACPPTCDDPDPVCIEKCVPENICSCPDGYVQRNKADKTCVKRSDCITKCPAPKVYKSCASMCQPTCQDRNPRSCNIMCNPVVCVCPPDMVQPDKDTLECIKPEDCPTICEPPKVAKGCGTACPATCDDPEPVCIMQCTGENFCRCPDGFVQRSSTDKTCVKLADCFDCPAPGIPVKCEEACPESCEGKSIFCRRECPSKYVCGCPAGYILLTQNGKECVKKGECPPKCPPPQRYVTCGSMCQPTCHNPKPASCKRGCNTRTCICPRDMVQPDEDTFTCIFPSDCPRECAAPKIHKACPSKCQPTCQDPTPDQDNCALGCRDDNCVCPPGLVLLSTEAKTCVKISKCPKQCIFPEVRVNCRSSCVARCDNLDSLDDVDCPMQCDKEVCVCANGYVQRSELDPTCVEVSSCPPVPTMPSDCPAPGIPVKCEKACPESCEGKSIFCRRECPSKYVCGCPAGYILLTQNGKECVKKGECPPKCPPPQRYVTCGSMCQPTCQNPKPASCKRGCNSRNCICPRDMVQPDEDTFTCIFPSDCPPQCEAPKVYAECASKCPPTCLLPKPLACTRGCDPTVECVCPPDYVQHDKKNTTCIKLEDCPTQCDAPKVYAECASKCPPTCLLPKPLACTRGCDPTVECTCPPNYVQHDKKNTTCIKLKDCPETCRFPYMATNCASTCPATCDDPVPTCEKGCKTGVGCVCPVGLLQRSTTNTTCLLPTQCPGLPDDCGQQKIPTRCASGCPATCANRNPRFCTKPCRPDVNCECSRGMVQRSLQDNTCVWPYQCEE